MNKKQVIEKTRWLVVTKLPKEKVLWMRFRGYSQKEIFGFPTKSKAKSFINRIAGLGVECLIAKS